MFKEKFINNKKVIYSDLVSDLVSDLEHFFTTRETVICDKSNDESEYQSEILQNKKDICKFLGINDKFLISPNQTHTSHVEIVQINKSVYPETDALILDNKEQAVFLNFADCTPVILYDKEHNIGAIAHAGWKGTAGRIVQKTIKKLTEEYNSNPESIYAIIGPAISDCCYNVGEDVFNKLKNSVSDIKNLYEIKNNEIFVNLKEINKKQILDINIPEQNIDICPYCTCCNNDLFFSYRKENGTTLRHSAVIKLK